MDKLLYDEILKYFKIYKKIASPKAVADFKAMPKSDLLMCHFGLGLYIRNNYLNHGNKLHQLFVADGVSHPDDMSGIMVQMWHEHSL